MFEGGLKRKFKQNASWILHGKYHLLSVICYVFTALYLSGALQFYPNTVALLMTLSGLLIILTQQINDATKFSFQEPNTFMGWIKSFPKRKHVTLSVNSASIATFSGKAHAKVSIPLDSTIEKKVNHLIRRIEELDSTIVEIDNRVDKVNSSLKEIRKELQKTINSISKTLNESIASHVVGSYDLSLFGINITICGTVIQFFFS